MPATIFCPNPDCGASYHVVDKNLGRIGRCKKCGAKFPLVPHTRDGGELPPSTDPFPGGEPFESGLPEAIGRYRVLRLLGRGGMGSVYLAEDAKLKRRVAIKVPHVTAFADRPDVLVRFLREAEAAARFRHPNFCPIFDLGEADGVPFLTMAYIEGQTLGDLIERDKGWPPRKAVGVIRQLASALAELHREGIVHRDLKPANIMVDHRGGLILMDFGLARWYDDPSFTTTGAVLGTPAYMSPEQAEGDPKAIGPRSDIYSLGVIFYELLTGRRPFEGSTTKILGMLAFIDPAAPSTFRPDLDPTLEAICLKAMAKKPEARYASMADLAREAQAWLDAPRPAAAPASPPRVGLGDLETIRDEPSAEVVRDAGRPIARRAVLLSAAGASLAVAGVAAAWLTRKSANNAIGMAFRAIPAGEFAMGSAKGDPDERPRHKVRITRAFELGATEVTVGQFRRFVLETGYKTGAERDKLGFGWDEARGAIVQAARFDWGSPGFDQTDEHPVVNVTWDDANAFCAWLSRQEGARYRLPTEAEWEYACRGGTTTRFSSGDDAEGLAAVGNVSDATTRAYFPDGPALQASDGHLFTAPVGRFRPNAWGLFDMHGNAWEWCSDWYDSTYYNKIAPDVADPVGPPTGTDRVMRGGSWSAKGFGSMLQYRASYRNYENPAVSSVRAGFRVVRVR